MGTVAILSQLAIVGVVGAAATVLLGRFRLPVVAGLLASGALLGPFGFALIREPRIIEVLAEAGVVLLGFIFAMSSTAIVLRSLSERGELDAPHGRFIVGTLV